MQHTRPRYPLKVIAHWPLKIVQEELARAGIYLLEQFPDGQTRWGTEPLGAGPYKGLFTMASEYKDGCYDIFQVQAIVQRLEKTDQLQKVEDHLYRRVNEGLEVERVEPPKPQGKSTNGEAKV